MYLVDRWHYLKMLLLDSQVGLSAVQVELPD